MSTQSAQSTMSREQRKATHARQQAQARQPPREVAESLVTAGIRAVCRGDAGEADRCAEVLARGLGAAGREVVDQVVVDFLQRGVHRGWERGWQPADLARAAERQLRAGQARLVVDAMAAQMRRYAAATVDDRWDRQLRALSAEVWWERDDHYLTRWGDREGLSRELAIRQGIELLHLLDHLPELPILCPLPGTAQPRRPRADAQGGAEANQRTLDRIRALLAKAESTEFAEEAEAFTAKAQELMARHSIDHALLSAGAGGREEPSGCRVSIDRPYEQPKALLLQKVAEANRCRVVWSKELGFTTVLGFPPDLAAVEMLYTSLLVQATTALVHAGTRRDRRGQSRTRAFRQSFLTAYAIRIGQRLKEAAEQASSDAVAAAGSAKLLPVLAARDRAVDEAVDAMFGRLRHRRSVNVNDREGWASGTAAADLASLDFRQGVAAGERAS
jgi:hypothetical protein